MTEPDPPHTTLEFQTAMLAIGKKLERAITAASERRVVQVVEYTQSLIAVLVVLTTCIGVAALSMFHPDVRMPAEWWTIVGLVIGFYFGRVRSTVARRDQKPDQGQLM